MKSLPPEFLERLKLIIPTEFLDQVVKSLSLPKPISLRVNTLKMDTDTFRNFLKQQRINFEEVFNQPEVFILPSDKKDIVDQFEVGHKGSIYQQGLSSLLVSCLLKPQKDQTCLDFCAAPGSKTSHMAALMQNTGKIIALEVSKDRFFKLRSVLEILDVRNVVTKLLDARKFKSEELFDRILVDAPCSSEGRFHLSNPKTFAYWSARKIKEMVHKQKGLLLNASRFLKPDGILIYSTCTFAPEENEAVLDWFLKKTKGFFYCEKINDFPEVKTYGTILNWNNKSFNPQIKNAIRLLPDEKYDGFFIAKLRRS